MTLFNQLILLNFKANLENVLTRGLPIMLAGMMGIFVVIGIIILVVTLLGKITDDENLAKGLKALFTKRK